jgi:hypothetical protein
MPKFTFNLLILFSIICTTSCSTTNKIATLKPEPDDATPLVYEVFLHIIPISVKLKDIENQTNTQLNGLIYEDNIIDDDIEMKIWKLAPITIKK